MFLAYAQPAACEGEAFDVGVQGDAAGAAVAAAAAGNHSHCLATDAGSSSLPSFLPAQTTCAAGSRPAMVDMESAAVAAAIVAAAVQTTFHLFVTAVAKAGSGQATGCQHRACSGQGTDLVGQAAVVHMVGMHDHLDEAQHLVLAVHDAVHLVAAAGEMACCHLC